MGHSAGGWLGRAFLGGAKGSGVTGGVTSDAAASGLMSSDSYSSDDEAAAARRPHPAVASLITLGTPQRPAARRGSPGAARDVTGGALGWVDESWPGAAFAGDGVRYLAVAGRAVRGCAEAAKAKERTLPGYAHAAYVQVGFFGGVLGGGDLCGIDRCRYLKPATGHPQLPTRSKTNDGMKPTTPQVAGEGDGVWGDCVVPTGSALLEGATNVVLDGVRHSMARIGSFDERAGAEHLWYGSPQVGWCDGGVGLGWLLWGGGDGRVAF
jgi:hypothetical protein